MKNPTPNQETPINNPTDLTNYFFTNTKKQQKIGIEFESFLYHKNTFQAINYQDIQNILSLYPQEYTKIYENNNLIGLSFDAGNISTEPAGQIEFSSIPCNNINEIAIYSNNYYKTLFNHLENLNLSLCNFGYNPIHSLQELTLLPKKRYEIMYNYMATVGTLGQSMMKATGTVQANLDYTSQQDLSNKFKISMALSPLIGLLFSNSPFKDKNLTPYQSYRNHIWQNTDKARSGTLDFVLSENFDINDYITYIINLPMYFILKDNTYYPSNNHTFKQYLNHEFKHNFIPSLEDFTTHISTIYHDVRLKTYLEMRTADCPTFSLLPSLPALYTGLLYNSTSIDNCLSLIKNININNLQEFKIISNKEGFKTNFLGKNILIFLQEILEIAQFGLIKRGLNEEIYLSPLFNLIKTKKTQSDILIQEYTNTQNIQQLIKNHSLTKETTLLSNKI
jgi:glutamate--cysteine ligase